jgi:hypothetical protein
MDIRKVDVAAAGDGRMTVRPQEADGSQGIVLHFPSRGEQGVILSTNRNADCDLT